MGRKRARPKRSNRRKKREGKRHQVPCLEREREEANHCQSACPSSREAEGKRTKGGCIEEGAEGKAVESKEGSRGRARAARQDDGVQTEGKGEAIRREASKGAEGKAVESKEGSCRREERGCERRHRLASWV